MITDYIHRSKIKARNQKENILNGFGKRGKKQEGEWELFDSLRFSHSKMMMPDEVVPTSVWIAIALHKPGCESKCA